jgi:uncharacterized membrane protein YGL010W
MHPALTHRLSQYEACHRHRGNRRIHTVAVPAIFCSLLALLQPLSLGLCSAATAVCTVYSLATLRLDRRLGLWCAAVLVVVLTGLQLLVLWLQTAELNESLSGAWGASRATPAAVRSLLTLAQRLRLAQLPPAELRLWCTCWAGIFLAAWLAQFVGHLLEGKRPAFLTDLIFLAVGPLWVLVDLLPQAPPRAAPSTPPAAPQRGWPRRAGRPPPPSGAAGPE